MNVDIVESRRNGPQLSTRRVDDDDDLATNLYSAVGLSKQNNYSAKSPPLQAIPAIATHLSVTWSVCLPVCLLSDICLWQSFTLGLYRLTDLDAICQEHLWDPMTLYQMGSLTPIGKNDLMSNPRKTCN